MQVVSSGQTKKKILFPVERPGESNSADWILFFFRKLSIFSLKKIKNKKGGNK